MSNLGDLTVYACNNLHHLPSIILCFLLIFTQAAVIDYYLIHHLDIGHVYWIVCDLTVFILFITCIHFTSKLQNDRKYVIVWVTWFALQSVLAAKVTVVCTNFSTDLDEKDSTFFGPNTLKTAIALGSCIFVLLLTSQHDAPLASERRRYIEELTGTVVFDILDTADILEILFDEKGRPSLSSGLPETVLSVATLNLLLPTVPLITLSKTKFGLEKLQRRYIYLHRLLVVLAVNVPNLLLRMALWHVYSVAISPFTLKNIILIFMTLYEFYEHKKGKYEEHKRKQEIELESQDMHNTNNDNERPRKLGTTNKKDEESYCSSNSSSQKGDCDHMTTSLRQNSTGSGSCKGSELDEVHFDIENRFVST